jgi:hypothetical protein
MKKLMVALVGAVVCVGAALADMDVKSDSATVIGTATGTVTFSVRGTIEGVYLNASGGTAPTGTVTIADSDGQTIFYMANMTTSTDGKFNIVVPGYASTSGALATWITDSAGSTNTVYTHGAPVVGTVTATIVGGNNAAHTNVWAVKLFVRK